MNLTQTLFTLALILRRVKLKEMAFNLKRLLNDVEDQLADEKKGRTCGLMHPKTMLTYNSIE
jgi:hypothetical protein